MIDNISRDKLLFADIETAGITASLADLEKLNKPLADVFQHYFDTGTLCKRFPEKECESAEQMFPEVAALITEFSRLVSIAFGVYIKGVWHTEVLASHDEGAMLDRTDEVLEKNFEQGRFLCIHNGTYFDVPFLVKKLIAHGKPLNPMLPVLNVKPWDYRLVDTQVAWQLGSRTSLARLDLLCAFLGVPSPKEGEVCGATLHEFYWGGVKIGGDEDARRLKVIGEYCMADVVALREVAFKMMRPV